MICRPAETRWASRCSPHARCVSKRICCRPRSSHRTIRDSDASRPEKSHETHETPHRWRPNASRPVEQCDTVLWHLPFSDVLCSHRARVDCAALSDGPRCGFHGVLRDCDRAPRSVCVLRSGCSSGALFAAAFVPVDFFASDAPKGITVLAAEIRSTGRGSVVSIVRAGGIAVPALARYGEVELRSRPFSGCNGQCTSIQANLWKMST